MTELFSKAPSLLEEPDRLTIASLRSILHPAVCDLILLYELSELQDR